MNAKEKLLAKIIRVNQAGELGAQKIYSAQKKSF
jgi:demethoxyubiquinone hydroxylase (CLK1/Coq7/Cat5 family)